MSDLPSTQIETQQNKPKIGPITLHRETLGTGHQRCHLRQNSGRIRFPNPGWAWPPVDVTLNTQNTDRRRRHSRRSDILLPNSNTSNSAAMMIRLNPARRIEGGHATAKMTTTGKKWTKNRTVIYFWWWLWKWSMCGVVLIGFCCTAQRLWPPSKSASQPLGSNGWME